MNVNPQKVKFAEKGTFPITSLTSFPGSGNTWVRYLIEEYTGYYTGAIGPDPNLMAGGFWVSQLKFYFRPLRQKHNHSTDLSAVD